MWIVAGGTAWIIARIVPAARAKRRPAAEAGIALLIAAAAGAAATALDFGGWNEPDWRAGLLAFFCAAAAVGITRAV